MLDVIVARVNEEADYIIEHKSSIRECAQAVNVSKSTVHTDMNKYLYQINPTKYYQVREILDWNRIHFRYFRRKNRAYKKHVRWMNNV